MIPIKRAILSVYDKTGIVDFAQALCDLGIELISSGGTARMLKEAGIPVHMVSDYTGFPEMLGGRVKTLHPKIHGGILAKRDEKDHMSQLQEHGIAPIDMVVVNLYPFEEWARKEDASLGEVIEMIDIGGPTMIRAAAKNYASVAVVTDSKQFDGLVTELKESKGVLSEATCQRLATEAFQNTAHYEHCIATYLATTGEQKLFPDRYTLSFEKVGQLRYGENPHQQAALYRDMCTDASNFIGEHQLGGKELSFNNFLDAEGAVDLVWEFDRPAAVVIKHTNPCGAALGNTLAEAYEKAYVGDPLSAFGSIVGFNRPVDVATAEKMAVPNTFFEVIIAPDFEEGTLDILTQKRWWGKTVRILRYDPRGHAGGADVVMKQIPGGLLLQHKDRETLIDTDLSVVTERRPTETEMEALRFAWTVVKHVKSNAILLAQGNMVIGVGAGQMSRVDSSIIAVRKAGERTRGSVLASDAFFPFRDALDTAAQVGVTAVIQPGGSKGDEKVIEAANEHDMAMVFTGMRHFRHL